MSLGKDVTYPTIGWMVKNLELFLTILDDMVEAVSLSQIDIGKVRAMHVEHLKLYSCIAKSMANVEHKIKLPHNCVALTALLVNHDIRTAFTYIFEICIY